MITAPTGTFFLLRTIPTDEWYVGDLNARYGAGNVVNPDGECFPQITTPKLAETQPQDIPPDPKVRTT